MIHWSRALQPQKQARIVNVFFEKNWTVGWMMYQETTKLRQTVLWSNYFILAVKQLSTRLERKYLFYLLCIWLLFYQGWKRDIQVCTHKTHTPIGIGTPHLLYISAKWLSASWCKTRLCVTSSWETRWSPMTENQTWILCDFLTPPLAPVAFFRLQISHHKFLLLKRDTIL